MPMRIAGLLVLVAPLPTIAYASSININTADATLLDTLPSIGPVIFAIIEKLIMAALSPQPSVRAAGYEKVQAVEPITSTKTNIQAHEEAVLAPTATTELAAVGARCPSQGQSTGTRALPAYSQSGHPAFSAS